MIIEVQEVNLVSKIKVWGLIYILLWFCTLSSSLSRKLSIWRMGEKKKKTNHLLCLGNFVGLSEEGFIIMKLQDFRLQGTFAAAEYPTRSESK